jgi:hypothetical protein
MDPKFIQAIRSLQHEIDTRDAVRMSELPGRKRKLADSAIKFGFIYAQPIHGDFVLLNERRA